MSTAQPQLTKHFEEISLPTRKGVVSRYFRETGLLIGRNLRNIKAVPQRLSDVTIQPIVFTVLFLYVFGSAIKIPGVRYEDYLLPGLIGQSIAFGVMGSGMATANDFALGVTDRFKSLPVTRLAIITAQVVGQVIEQCIGMIIVGSLGLLLGWQPQLDFLGALQLIGLILLGLFAFTTLGVLLGLLIRDGDAVMGIGFAIIFPLSFLGGTFVPIEGMKEIPRAIAHWDPVSALVAAIRHTTQGYESHGSWQLENPEIAMVIWCAVIIAISVPIALRRFKTLVPKG